MDEIILASASPRRKELLEKAGVSFEICTADTDETTDKQVPWEVVMELSLRKAQAVWELKKQDLPRVVIGADTVVSKGSEILGKPKDEADALAMLKKLSGTVHQVYTGVTLIYRRNDGSEKYETLTFLDTTKVHFYPVSEELLKKYIATGEPMDKAGAYGIQGLAGLFIEGIHGDIDNVIGLPVPRLLQEAKKVGLILSPWQ